MSAFTTIPRWTRAPVAGVGEYDAKLSDEVVAALRRLADDLAVPFSAMLLTAHAKVLGALSGEREVCTGYAVKAKSPLPLRLTLTPRTWRDLLLATGRPESCPSEALFETVFELGADDVRDLAGDIVMRVRFVEQGGLMLKLRYRSEVIEADCAARIAGYHL